MANALIGASFIRNADLIGLFPEEIHDVDLFSRFVDTEDRPQPASLADRRMFQAKFEAEPAWFKAQI